MCAASYDRPFFIPAETEAEAIGRIFALTGRANDGTRGEKRALVALRDALALDIDIVRTNAVLGQALAAALDVEWDERHHVERNKVTLDGLNVLLEGAMEAYQAGSLTRVKDNLPDTLTGPAWAQFQPARSKIEAVTRMAGLTGAPKESLGPGSKEHKSALLNLADALFQDRPLNKSSKTKLGASLAEALDVPWTDMCSSTGQTVSLVGLNTILAGAERHLGLLGAQIADMLRTPLDEGDALAAALLDGLPDHWDGRMAVRWLAERRLRGSNDNEWQGFYGEERAKIALAAAYSPKDRPPRVRYGNTMFDYSLNWVWDIKVHTEIQVYAGMVKVAKNETPLNDEQAIRECVEEQGLGFLTISGAAQMDETGEFLAWHRAKKSAAGVVSARSNSGNSRTRKAAFDPLHVEAFWVPNTEALLAAIAAGQVRPKPQGRQAPGKADTSGASRRDKFEMRMRQARAGICVARYDWPERK